MTEQIPNCVQCVHYYVTYDSANPYGCRAMKFKSKTHPAKVVYAASGIICQLFSKKKQSVNKV